MQTIKTAVIGLGVISEVHFDYFKNLEELKLTAVCDINPERVKTAAEKYRVKGYTDYRNMFEQEALDAVLILTDHFSHYPIAMCAFEHNVHVLCEKPITVRSSQAQEMINMAGKKNLVLAVDFCLRSIPHYKKIADIIHHRLGKILRADIIETRYFRTMAYYKSAVWRGTWKGEGGGILMNQAPHILDLIYWWFGQPEKISARLANKHHDIEVEDDVEIFMTYPEDARLRFYSNTWETPAGEYIYIVGEQGILSVNDNEMKFSAFERKIKEIINSPSDSLKDQISHTEKIEKKTIPFSSQYEITKNFIDKLLGKTENLLVSGKDAAGSFLMANAAVVSHMQKKEIILKNFHPSEFDQQLEMLTSGKQRLTSRD